MVRGDRAYLITVEVMIDPAGQAGQVVHGMPPEQAWSVRDRIRAAVLNSGERWPTGRITVSLSPGLATPDCDLAVAIAVLTAAGTITPAAVHGVALLGELGLDARLRPVEPPLPAPAVAPGTGIRRVVVATDTVAVAGLILGTETFGVDTLADLLAFPRGSPDHAARHARRPQPDIEPPALDLADLSPAITGRRELEIGQGSVVLSARMCGFRYADDMRRRLA